MTKSQYVTPNAVLRVHNSVAKIMARVTENKDNLINDYFTLISTCSIQLDAFCSQKAAGPGMEGNNSISTYIP